VAAWHDQDRWWEGTRPALFRAWTWDRAPQQVEQVLALAGIEPPVRVLDMPCGVGRHALEFARLGCMVTGVDRTEAYLREARERAEELGLKVEFVEGDMREFRREGTFDLGVNLFTSFGYFEDQAEDVAVLRNFHESLRPDGTLIMEMAGKEIIARDFQPRDWRELDDGALWLEERRVTHDWTWIENRWILIKDGERREFPLATRLYGAAELRRVLEEAGFETIRVYGSLGGAAYDHEAERLIAVARRAGE
jgi:SAM-dependent methyltransferase